MGIEQWFITFNSCTQLVGIISAGSLVLGQSGNRSNQSTMLGKTFLGQDQIKQLCWVKHF